MEPDSQNAFNYSQQKASMRCEREYVNMIRSRIGFDTAPIEEAGTMNEENCFAYAGIYFYNGKYVVYMKNEEQVCIEELDSIEDARRLAKKFVESIC